MLDCGFYFVRSDGYEKFDAKLISRDVYPQVPINPAKLDFETSKFTPVHDYAEIILVSKGQHVFHGDITKIYDKGTTYRCECKSVEWRLSWRYIPNYIFAAGSTMAEIFSSDSTPFPSGSVPSFGLLYMLQSIVPNGQFEAYSATVAKLPGGGTNSALHGHTLRASNNYPGYATDETGAATLSVASSLAAITEMQYWKTSDDLYIMFGDGSFGPNAFLVFADYWLDCKIRSAVTDSRTSTKDLSLHGKAVTKLDDLIRGLGLEAQFLPYPDGYVYMALASEVSRGSATDPREYFIDGLNCKIKTTPSSSPSIQAAIGVLDDIGATAASCDWDSKEIQLMKVVEGKGEGKPALEARLDAEIANNQPSIEVEIPRRDFFLRVGDWVKINSEATGIRTLRITKIHNTAENTKIEVGRMPFNLSAAFGNMTRPEIDTDLDLISVTRMSGGSATTRTGSFVVTSANINAGGWRCYYKEEFTQSNDGTAVSTTAFVDVTIESKKVPPGRIKLTSTSLEVDITDYCTTSTTSNSTNTFSRTIYNSTGWTPSADYPAIEQYKGRSFV